MNRILQVVLHNHALDPATAEVWLTVVPEQPGPGLDVRGRLTGPHSAFASTVEIAYHLRPLGPGVPDVRPAGAIQRRVVIPEPSFWEPERPFLYEGPVELWQDGKCLDRQVVRHGLSILGLGPDGLRLNARPLKLRGPQTTPVDQQALHELRAQGRNTIVSGTQKSALRLWEQTDRLGMICLNRLPSDAAQALRLMEDMAGHVSCLGVLVGPEVNWLEHVPGKLLVGVELDQPTATPLPARVNFVVGPVAAAESLATLGRPLLLLGGPTPEGLAVPVLGLLDS